MERKNFSVAGILGTSKTSTVEILNHNTNVKLDEYRANIEKEIAMARKRYTNDVRTFVTKANKLNSIKPHRLDKIEQNFKSTSKRNKKERKT